MFSHFVPWFNICIFKYDVVFLRNNTIKNTSHQHDQCHGETKTCSRHNFWLKHECLPCIYFTSGLHCYLLSPNYNIYVYCWEIEPWLGSPGTSQKCPVILHVTCWRHTSALFTMLLLYLFNPIRCTAFPTLANEPKFHLYLLSFHNSYLYCQIRMRMELLWILSLAFCSTLTLGRTRYP